MTAFHATLGALLVLVNLGAGAWGAWRWWRYEPSRAFWPALRTGQALVAIEAIDGAVLLVLGRELPDLHLIYGLIPLGVSFLAEQLRLTAADTVLQAAGLEGTEAVGRLPDAEQRALVLAIVRREMGVMAVSALVVAALGVRASGLL